MIRRRYDTKKATKEGMPIGSGYEFMCGRRLPTRDNDASSRFAFVLCSAKCEPEGINVVNWGLLYVPRGVLIN